MRRLSALSHLRPAAEKTAESWCDLISAFLDARLVVVFRALEALPQIVDITWLVVQ